MGSLVRHWSGRAAPAWDCASVAHWLIPGAESVGSRLGGGRDCRHCHLREAAAPTSLTRRVCALDGIAFAILIPPGDAVFVHHECSEHIVRAPDILQDPLAKVIGQILTIDTDLEDGELIAA